MTDYFFFLSYFYFHSHYFSPAIYSFFLGDVKWGAENTNNGFGVMTRYVIRVCTNV